MSQCPSCGGDCGYGPLRHCQQGINHETDFRKTPHTSDEGLLNATKADKYKRMFEAACIELGYINMALNIDPDAGGSVPIIEAIANKDSLIDKLTTTLEKANAQTEEFERRWYLVQDKVEELYTQGQGLRNEINDFQSTIERQSVENQKRKGQQAVLIDLLRECLSVLNTIDGDDCHEVECLADLELKCEKAIEGALQ